MTRSIPFDAGRHARAKIGYVLLATEQTIQDDIVTLRPDGVGVHIARAPIPDSITPETLMAQADHLAGAAATLLPDGSLDVVCYACTSGSLVIGEERVFAEFRKGAPNAVPTSIITGVIEGLHALGAKRLAVATPYLAEIDRQEVDYLNDAGFEVVNIDGLRLEKDSEMVRVPPDYIADFALETDRAEADALFVSCGALRTLDVVGDLERRAGKPVICSNQAMIWDCLRKAGIEDRFTGYGTLLEAH